MLFQRNLDVAVPNSKTHRAANWYMRLKIAGQKGYYTRSTKLTKYEEAFDYAQAEFLRLQQAARMGHSLGLFVLDLRASFPRAFSACER